MNRLYLRAAAVGAAATLVTAVIVGVPSDVVPNPWFTRQIDVDAFDVATLAALSVLAGALAVTYAVARGPTAAAERAGVGSGLLGFIAISCPVCNKLVVALIGVAGASGWFASIQPLLGAGAIALVTTALVISVRAIKRTASAIDVFMLEGPRIKEITAFDDARGLFGLRPASSARGLAQAAALAGSTGRSQSCRTLEPSRETSVP